MMSRLHRPAAALLIALFVAFPLAIPRQAHAALPVIDIEALLKENLDVLAWSAANVALESVTKSVVNWINSGFNGSPAFVQDLSRNLQGVADATAARFIGQLGDQLADTPMRGAVEAVAYGYYLSTSGDAYLRRQLYTLRNTVQNDVAFTSGDFSQGGWRGWFALTGNPANNIHGTLLSAKRELDRRIENSLDQRLTELGWGRGFLSWRGECIGSGTVNLGNGEECAAYEIQTPGSVVEQQLNSTLGLPTGRLQVADEVNEIVGALMSQLVTQALQGLNSIGSRSSGGSGYIDRATQQTTQTQTQTGGTNVDTLLLSGIEGQIAQVTQYQADWQKIATVAAEAQACSNKSASETTLVQDAQTRSGVALVKAASALASLEDVFDTIRSTLDSGTGTNAFARAAQTYQEIAASGVIPSATEIAESAVVADETSTTSLYGQVKGVADRCSATS